MTLLARTRRIRFIWHVEQCYEYNAGLRNWNLKSFLALISREKRCFRDYSICDFCPVIHWNIGFMDQWTVGFRYNSMAIYVLGWSAPKSTEFMVVDPSLMCCGYIVWIFRNWVCVIFHFAPVPGLCRGRSVQLGYRVHKRARKIAISVVSLLLDVSIVLLYWTVNDSRYLIGLSVP